MRGAETVALSTLADLFPHSHDTPGGASSVNGTGAGTVVVMQPTLDFVFQMALVGIFPSFGKRYNQFLSEMYITPYTRPLQGFQM